MNPIIHPFWFYLMGMVDSLKNGMCMLACLLFALGCIGYVVTIFSEESEKSQSQVIALMKFKKFLWIGIMIFFLQGLIPSQETCYQMMAASMVTPNNIDTIGESAQTVVDYIVDSVDELLEEGE